MASAAVMLLGTLALQGEFQFRSGNMTDEPEMETGLDAAGEVINIYEETGMVLDKERELEMALIDGTIRSFNVSDWFSYSVIWSSGFLEYGELTGPRVSIALPTRGASYFVAWDEETGYTPYFAPEGGMDMPHVIPDDYWTGNDGKDAIQGSAMTLRDLNTYLLERLFIELNNQNAEEYKGEYQICDYSVTNRYWTDNVIGTEIVFHVKPKAERAEDLEYFQGVLARVWLTDTEKIKEVLADLEIPGEDEWRSVPHPELAVEEGMIPYSAEPSPRMEAVIEELSGMLAEKGYTSEEADRIANTLMGYYSGCAKWLTEEQEYAFWFRTQLNEDGNPVSISIDRSGGGGWNTYVPHPKTKEEQQAAYFQAGYNEMNGRMSVMF